MRAAEAPVPEPLPLRNVLFRPSAADLLAAAYALAYFVWLAIRARGTATTALVGDIFFAPLGLAVAWAAWRNARAFASDRRTGLAWRWLAASALLLGINGNVWSAYLRVLGPNHWPAWLSWLDPLQALCAIVAYLTFPHRSVPRSGGGKFLIDTYLIVVAGFVPAFYFSLRTLTGPAGSVWSYAGVTMLVHWVMFVTAAVGIIHKRDPSTRIALVLLLVAHADTLVANYWLAGMTSYHSGDAVDALWFIGWVLKWTAVRVAWHRWPRDRQALALRGEQPASDFAAGLFAYLMVAGAFVLLMTQILTGDRRVLSVLAASAVVMATLLFFRQVAALAENRRLFAAQIAQEARFRSLVQHSSDVVLVVDDAGVITYVSPSAASVFGERAGLRVGARAADVFPDAHAAVMSTPAGPGPGGAHRSQTRIQVGADAWKEIEVVSTDLRGDAAVGGMVLNCRDITERVTFERTLMHAQKLDAVGRLAGGLAHDFNNVLAIIRGYAELMREDLPPGSKAAADLSQIEYAADRAAGVTKKVLGLSRHQPVQRVVLDLNAVLTGLEAILRQLLTDRIEVRVDRDPALWRVVADQGQMEQVLINLATNARDAMPDGGHLRVTTANRVIEAGAAAQSGPPPGRYAVLTVADEGVGMLPEVQARIFEPFFTTKPLDRGVGLGLAMVHGIVVESGGHISAVSAPGAGTTFTVFLPAAADGDTARPAFAAAAAPDRPGRSILLVDDEASVRAVARRILERHGHRVIEASSGREALVAVADTQVEIDVFVTDMVMPQMHGRELIERVRALRPDVPIICLTGFADDADQVRDFGAAVVALVVKPFTADALVGAVARALVAREPGTA